MKNLIYTFLIGLLCSPFLNAQGKGPKIGYINMEYILENLPEYAQANSQLETNMSAWKKEIDKKKNEIDKLKKNLEAEKPLLTKEMIEDAEEEIKFQEGELFDYQQNIFGPTGVLMSQKNNLIKPLQDQVFNVVKDIAEAKRYDFIFDKSADVIMLFAAKRYDISDQVVRAMARISKKEKLTKKQLKELDDLEAKQAMIEENPQLTEKQIQAEELKKKREQMFEERKQLIEKQNAEKEEKKKKLIEDRELAKQKKKEGTNTPVQSKQNENTVVAPKIVNDSVAPAKQEEVVPVKVDKAEELKQKREQLLEERKQLLEKRKKEQEEKRQQLLNERAKKMVKDTTKVK